MAQTPSTMLELGTPAPGFHLPDPSGKLHSLDDHPGARGHLIAFVCNHCPFVKHIRTALADFGRAYVARGIAMYAINSNDFEAYPDDAPAKMKELAAKAGWVFPYLVDEAQEIARAYRAACTPDFFLFDAGRKLVYRGQFDDSRPGNGKPVTGSDLRAACDALLEGHQIPKDQKPSIGCNIKWRKGNEPEWFGG